MQKLKMVVESRLLQEWRDLAVDYPKWLTALADDDLYYTVTLITTSICSFGLGLVIALLASI
jgi:hypothetical protein